MRKFQWLTLLLLLGLTIGLLSEPAIGQNEREGQRPSFIYSFTYTPLYQFETDLDGGGSFDVIRNYLSFDAMRSFSRKVRIGLGLSYDYESWHFDNLSNIIGATPWSSIHRPGISLPLLFTVSDGWIIGLTPSIGFSGESGAEADESFTYGSLVWASHTFGENFSLGLGLGIFDQLEKTSFFPFIAIKWRISENFQIANPFRAGPAGPAGLELVYTPGENWELGVGGSYRSYRFRLNDNAAIPNGVGDNEFMVSFLRLGWKIGTMFTLDLLGGAFLDGELSVDNSEGHELGSEKYDTSPFVALTFKGDF